jgi:hypothetical protein
LPSLSDLIQLSIPTVLRKASRDCARLPARRLRLSSFAQVRHTARTRLSSSSWSLFARSAALRS